jgi:lipopolysaccharide biosynthesis glycosyltransferase
MTIAFLVFGKDILNFQQAIFSILTILPKMDKNERIVVITDVPEYFKMLGDKITVLEVDEKIFENWKGEYNFFWRIKIMALQMIADKWKNDHVLYLDSDTFLFGNLEGIRLNLNSGINMMHTNEGKLSELASKTERTMWKQLKGRTYGNITIDNNTCMWNAGVVAIAGANRDKLDLALTICDEMCKENVTPRLIEQLALSLAMNEPMDLLAAENEIGHYWGNKKTWNKIINKLLLINLMRSLTLEHLIDEVKEIKFDKTPIRVKTSSTKLKLEKKLSKIFPDKMHMYITSENQK